MAPSFPTRKVRIKPRMVQSSASVPPISSSSLTAARVRHISEPHVQFGLPHFRRTSFSDPRAEVPELCQLHVKLSTPALEFRRLISSIRHRTSQSERVSTLY